MRLNKKQINKLIDLSRVLTKDEFKRLLQNRVINIDKTLVFSSFEDLDEELFISENPHEDVFLVENIIFQIKDVKLVEILLFNLLGYNSKETSEIINKSLATYYVLRYKLRKEVRDILKKNEEN